MSCQIVTVIVSPIIDKHRRFRISYLVSSFLLVLKYKKDQDYIQVILSIIKI